MFRYTVFPKKSTRTPCVGGGRLAVGRWRLAIGSGLWQLVVVGGGWWLVVGDWWLMAVGSGWRLAVGRRWRLAAVGGWRLVAVGGWWLAVDGPLGRSLRAVLNKKKSSSLRTPLVAPLTVEWLGGFHKGCLSVPPSNHKCCFCLLAPLPRRCRQCFTFSHSHESEAWRLLTTTSDVINVTQGQGVLDRQVSPISGARHFQAFCHGFLFPVLLSGGGGAIKAERVCRLVLPGKRMCAPFEEGILHSWIGGLVANRLGWGEVSGFTKTFVYVEAEHYFGRGWEAHPYGMQGKGHKAGCDTV